MSQNSKASLLSTHDIHFDYVIMDLAMSAYENDKVNQTNRARPIRGTGRHKKSSVQNGASSVACLLLYIRLESAIRRCFYSLSEANREKAYGGKLFRKYKAVRNSQDNIEYLEAVFDDLTTLRDTIAHCYLFSGEIAYSDEHELIGIKEKAIGGMNKDKAKKRLTPTLKLHTSPNQICFRDIAIFYFSVRLLLEEAGLSLGYEIWEWKKGDEVEPDKWFIRAMKSLHYGNLEIWKKLQQLLEDKELADFLAEFDKLGFNVSDN